MLAVEFVAELVVGLTVGLMGEFVAVQSFLPFSSKRKV
jgi:hypothetical protein